MGSLFENLKNYFENTPQDVLEKDWKEVEYLNEMGPDVIEYAAYVRENYGDAAYMQMHQFDVPADLEKAEIPSNSQYCLAA